jgi:hypothetical protein
MAQDEIAVAAFSSPPATRWTVNQHDEGPSKFQMCSAHLVLKPTYKPWPNPRARPYSPNSAGARRFYSSPRRRRSPRLATPAPGAAGARYLTRQLSAISKVPCRNPETQRLPTDYCNSPRAEYQSMVVATRFKFEFLPE